VLALNHDEYNNTHVLLYTLNVYHDTDTLSDPDRENKVFPLRYAQFVGVSNVMDGAVVSMVNHSFAAVVLPPAVFVTVTVQV
jgi:hypothetical protein